MSIELKEPTTDIVLTKNEDELFRKMLKSASSAEDFGDEMMRDFITMTADEHQAEQFIQSMDWYEPPTPEELTEHYTGRRLRVDPRLLAAVQSLFARYLNALDAMDEYDDETVQTLHGINRKFKHAVEEMYDGDGSHPIFDNRE